MVDDREQLLQDRELVEHRHAIEQYRVRGLGYALFCLEMYRVLAEQDDIQFSHSERVRLIGAALR